MPSTTIASSALLAIAALALPGLASAQATGQVEVQREQWHVETLIKGAPVRDVHGLAIGPDGAIYVTSNLSRTILRIDAESGEISQAVRSPDAEADDIRFSPDGHMYWTTPISGRVQRLVKNRIQTVAESLPDANGLAFNRQGRLFVTQVFGKDALWEIDPDGVRPPVKIVENIGSFNGINFAPDGRLCGALWSKGEIACINVDTRKMDIVSKGLKLPAGVAFTSTGDLIAVELETGDLLKINVATGRKKRFARLKPMFDNLTVGPDDTVYVTNMADISVAAIDAKSGKTLRTYLGASLIGPGQMAVQGGKLYVADASALRAIDVATGAVEEISRNIFDVDYASLLAASPTRLATASLYSGNVNLWDLGRKSVIARWEGLPNGSALGILDDDRIVAGGSEGSLIELDRRDPASRKLIASGLGVPSSLIRTDGGWYVADRSAGRLLRIKDDGSVQTILTNLAQPEGLAMLGDGRVVLAETGERRVLLVEPKNKAYEVAASGLPIGATFILPGQAEYPTGVAVDRLNHIYVSSDRDGSILRLRPR